METGGEDREEKIKEQTRGGGRGSWEGGTGGRESAGKPGAARGPRLCGCRHTGDLRKVPGNVRARSRTLP